MTPRKPADTSALAALSQAERAALLGDLLAEHPELVGDAERLANRRLASADRHAVADDISWSLGSLELEQLNLHAGYQRGRGYVHPVEAASELLEEALQPYLDDIGRLAGLGLPAAAQEVAAGVLLGLYQYRDQPPEDTVMVEARPRGSRSSCPTGPTFSIADSPRLGQIADPRDQCGSLRCHGQRDEVDEVVVIGISRDRGRIRWIPRHGGNRRQIGDQLLLDLVVWRVAGCKSQAMTVGVQHDVDVVGIVEGHRGAFQRCVIELPVRRVDTWIWNLRAYAASQSSTTRLTCCAEPKST